MSKQSSLKVKKTASRKRRQFPEEFKAEAVQLLLDGHSASSICERLGLSSATLLYRWKRDLVQRGGSTAVGLEGRVRELEAELRRVERERDILKKALAIFGRDG
ncbi:MAG: transposase [Nitrospiraceae bacterium]